MTLSVIIPVFNEEKTLLKIISKVLQQKEVGELIVVDDGSSDNSLETLRQIKNKRIKVIIHQKNSGKGTAIISGIKNATGDLIIIQDADLELDPRDYAKLLVPIKNKETDFVLGNRWNENKHLSITRIGNWYLSQVTNLLFNTKITDPYCCYKLASRKLWQKLNLESPGFEIEAEIISKVCRLGYKIKEVPVSYHPRQYHEGKKIRALDALRGTFKLLTIRLR